MERRRRRRRREVGGERGARVKEISFLMQSQAEILSYGQKIKSPPTHRGSKAGGDASELQTERFEMKKRLADVPDSAFRFWDTAPARERLDGGGSTERSWWLSQPCRGSNKGHEKEGSAAQIL